MSVMGDYKIMNQVFEDEFTKTFKAEHMNLEGKLALIKQAKDIRSEPVKRMLKREAEVLWELDEYHSIPHIKEYHELGRGIFVNIMDYFCGNTIEDYIKPINGKIDVEKVCWITERLLGALHYIHYNRSIHGDVKPANIVIEEKKHDIKLMNFGLAQYDVGASAKPIGYTKDFSAPEILNDKKIYPHSDIYSAGITMIYALGGSPSLKTVPPNVPEKIREFCYRLTNDDPKKRPFWDKNNLLKEMSDIRYEVFKRRHTESYDKTSI